jgi:TctA family transporter
MDEPVRQALEQLFDPYVLRVMFLTAAFGIFVGAVPGLTATMAVALLIPFTFFLSDVAALAAIVTLEACAIFAGDIPGALVRIPGTPASAAYTQDAYALTLRGRQDEALGISLVFSVAGGLFGALVLIFGAPLLGGVAAQFTTYENFWLMVLGLSCGAVVSGASQLKAALALLLGLLLSTVGLGAVHATPRFTFGRDDLVGGIGFIPAMIGLFGVSEVLRGVFGHKRREAVPALESPRQAGTGRRLARALLWPFRTFWALVAPALPLLWRRKLHALRSGSIGAFVGMLPGAGADIAAWISFGASKRFSRRPEDYGRGSAEGLADATCANNSALAGAWVPALVFGIPGDSVTAIVIGVLLMKNVTPGPEIFAKQPVLVASIYGAFIIANLMLLPLGWLAIRAGTWIVRVPRRVLLPIVLLFCVVGSYAVSASAFDVFVMLAMGVLGYVLERWGVPLGPVVLAITLGEGLEKSFIQSLTKSDSLLDFFSRPVAGALGALTLGLWILPIAWRLWRRGRRDSS